MSAIEKDTKRLKIAQNIDKRQKRWLNNLTELAKVHSTKKS